MTKDKNIITPQQFVDELRRYQKGSVTRRHFLGVTGLGLATAVLGGAMPGLKPRKAYAALSGTVNFTTWPSYFAQENIDKFTKDTGVKINIAVFGSNEEMLAKLQAGSTGWDVFVPTNYAISTYKELNLIEELDHFTAVQIHHVIVMLALRQLEYRMAGFEIVPNHQTRALELG